uniref:Uncharacterized protein n=1 Tax=Panagrolaimus superbus TaxID=310955 RepID=A0A914YUC9_9BILA
MRSLGEMFMGPERDPYVYGPQSPFQQPRNQAQNQFGYGVNAGVYAGTYGGNGGGGGGGGQSVAGPYGNRNSHIGGSYSGYSGWPVLPWIPRFNPLTVSSPTTLPSTIASSTTVTPLIATTLLQDIPLASVIELPLLETIEN